MYIMQFLRVLDLMLFVRRSPLFIVLVVVVVVVDWLAGLMGG